MYILILVFLCFGFCFCFFFFFLYLSEIVSYLSQGTTLDEGTIIITGTPSGVGYTQTPPLWLQHGDVVECEIENIGILQNKIEFEHYQEEKEKEQGNQQDGTTNTRLISIGDENLKKYIVEKEKRFNVEPKMQYIQQSNKPRSMSEIQQEVDLEYDAEALANHSMFEIEYDTNYKKLNNPKKKETEKDQRNNLLNLELWELQDELDSRGCDIDHKKWGGLSTKRKKKKLIFYLMKEMEKKNETTIDVFPQKEQFFEKRTEYQNKQKEQKEKKELKELSKKEWKEIVPVMMGRKLEVLRANKTCGWFNFKELCHQPLGAADYIAISQRFPVVIIDSVPQLGASYYNEARRFVTMIDAMYEANCRLVIASTVPLDSLFVSFEATVETKDGDEEIAVMEQTSNIDVGNDEQEQKHTSTAIKKNTGIPTIKENAIANQQGDEESWVSGEGGSSSSGATTMIRTKDGDMEWSATGRIGVSLAQLSAVKDVVFSFKRAESRLMEMSGTDWGREN